MRHKEGLGPKEIRMGTSQDFAEYDYKQLKLYGQILSAYLGWATSRARRPLAFQLESLARRRYETRYRKLSCHKVRWRRLNDITMM